MDRSKSLAIAYAMQRRNKARKMAEGGEFTRGRSASEDVDKAKQNLDVQPATPVNSMDQDTEPTREPANSLRDVLNAAKKKFASGGSVDGDDTVDSIMARCYSKGGQVANETGDSADDLPNEFDDLALRDDLDSTYDGENSGDLDGMDELDRILARRRR